MTVIPGAGPAALSLPWRADGRIVCAQAGDQPADTDEVVARFADPNVALDVVQRHNGALAGL